MDPVVPPPTDGATDQSIRVAGPGRIETAIQASRHSYGDGQADAVVLTRPDLFPDALAGTSLAVARNAPLLLTPTDELQEQVAAEILRVLPAGATVYLLGGTEALAPIVAESLTTLGFEVVRYGGSNRFGTAAVVAELGLEAPATVILADGTDFPDAVTAGAAAGHVGAAVLLTGGDTMPAETRAYLDANQPDQVYAAGGPAARSMPQATGLVGVDRIQTAVRVAEQFFDDPPVVGIATGHVFPDALAGGAVVARQGGPMLLTFDQGLDPTVQQYLADNAASLDQVLVFGGTAAISDDIAAAATAAIHN